MFDLHIETGNAAFDEGNAHLEVARILRELAKKIEQSEFMEHKLYDINGNRVGECSYEPELEEDEESEEIDLRKTINWMDSYQIQEILERYGFAVYDEDDTHSLREALFVNIKYGTIPAEELP